MAQGDRYFGANREHQPFAKTVFGRTDFVVSLDRHLLDLGEVSGVRVLKPGDFLRELRAERG